jgi:hypothetical protein
VAIASLMRAMASSRGSTPAMAKKQVCMMVLMRPPSPAADATREASMTKNAAASGPARLDFARQAVPDRVGPERSVEQEDAAGLECLEHVEAVEEIELVAGDEGGTPDQVGRADRAAGRSAGARSSPRPTFSSRRRNSPAPRDRCPRR